MCWSISKPCKLLASPCNLMRSPPKDTYAALKNNCINNEFWRKNTYCAYNMKRLKLRCTKSKHWLNGLIVRLNWMTKFIRCAERVENIKKTVLCANFYLSFEVLLQRLTLLSQHIGLSGACLCLCIWFLSIAFAVSPKVHVTSGTGGVATSHLGRMDSGREPKYTTS